MARVEPVGSCWLWIGRLTHNGYGFFKRGRSNWVLAHRWAYRHWIGEIPVGLDIDHTCRQIRCVNPLHLEPVTHAENMRRKRAAITACRRGHALEGVNVLWRTSADGWRYRRCRTCVNASNQVGKRRRRCLP